MDANFENIWLIECSTGCSCCSYDNHYRGPYKSLEEAQKRKKYFLAKDSDYCPVASQYARRGLYYIKGHKIERINGDRFIIYGEVYDSDDLNCVTVKDNGSVENTDLEIFPMGC